MGARHIRALLRASVILAVLLCLVFTVGITVAHADSEGAATVTASALNIRSEPSTASTIVACVPRGSVVLVTGESGDWYAVYYQGHTGYMNKSYLSYSASASANFGTGTVKGNYVNVRSGPSTAYSVVGQVSTGVSFPVTGVNGAFYQISYNNATAYISSAYVTVSSSSGGSSAPTVTPAPQQSQGAGVITGNYVRMRSGPGTGYTILGTYNSGTRMTITGQSGDWYAVSYNGMQGYVYKQYLSQSGVTADVTEMSAAPALTTAGVNLREGPSTAYTSKRVLAAGTAVTVNGKSGQWYRVDWNGVSGYIYQDYISLVTGQNSGSGAGQRIVDEARKYLGVPYVYGGTSPSGFDCSGFVYYTYKQCGWSITRTATAQNSVGTAVTRADLQPGDIIIFYNGAKTAIGHSGIYIGNNQFIHASSGGGKVMISGLSESYYNTRFYSARRVVN